jgi:ABC-type Fe3+-siderophore transport system permease subunit
MPNLDSLLYQFIVGGLIFFIGIFAALRVKDYSWKNKSDRTLLAAMILGFFIYLLSHIIWYLFGLGKL